MARTITDIAEDLRKGIDRTRKCTLLIGAGCSKTAGIPLAADIVRDIKTKFLRVYERALKRAQGRNASTPFPSYGDCMAEMDPGPQRDLIRGYIDKARLNWAHVGIGSLVANGYVDRLLTTNFDPLIAQGCAVFNEFPAVYDLTMSPTMRFEQLPDKAVFHLHGQRNGFSLLNDPHELAQHRQVVEPLFQHAREGRTWIVCGYSGENDPLFELIQQNQRYDYALYWIGREKEAPRHVQKFMGDADRTRCHYLQFAGADEFFVQLSHALGHFPPPFMNDPLSHVARLLERFTDFPVNALDDGIDLLNDAKNRIKLYQKQVGGLAQKSTEQAVVVALVTGDTKHAARLVAHAKHSGNLLPSAVTAYVAFAEGHRLYELALTDTANASQLIAEAAKAYSHAVDAKPDMHEALNNWGTTLVERARRGENKSAKHLWVEGFEKFAAALKIKPDKHQTLDNWGLALSRFAQQSDDETAGVLWQQAFEKFEQALKIKPDSFDTLRLWGDALDELAELSDDPLAGELWLQAFSKFESALKIKPESYEVLVSWAAALNRRAQRVKGVAAINLWRESLAKSNAALTLNPNLPEALNNAGSALLYLSLGQDPATASDLLQQAVGNFKTALQIKPTLYQARVNWGHALDQLARLSPREAAQELWRQTFEMYKAAIEIKPDLHETLAAWAGALLRCVESVGDDAEASRMATEAYERATQAYEINAKSGAYDAACVQARRGELASMVEWLDRAVASGNVPDREHLTKDTDFDGVRNTAEFKAWLTKMGWDKEA